MHASFDSERKGMLIGLMRALGDINAETVGWKVIRDESRDGVWPTARRAWIDGLRHNATHHLVIQDDIAVCRDFLASVNKTLELHPTSPISYFDLSRTITDALDKGSHWATRRSLSMAQAVVLPTDMIMPALTWIGEFVKPTAEGDDERFSAYFLSHNVEVWYTAPSLVDHVDNGHSLLKHPDTLPTGKRRVAAAFIGTGASGLSIDWTVGIERPHRRWSHSLSEYDRIMKERTDG